MLKDVIVNKIAITVRIRYVYGAISHTVCIWLYCMGIHVWYIPLAAYAYGIKYGGDIEHIHSVCISVLGVTFTNQIQTSWMYYNYYLYTITSLLMCIFYRSLQHYW